MIAVPDHEGAGTASQGARVADAFGAQTHLVHTPHAQTVVLSRRR